MWISPNTASTRKRNASLSGSFLELSSTTVSPYSASPVKVSGLLVAQSQELHLLSVHKLEDEGRRESGPGVQRVLSTGTCKVSVWWGKP